jgi:Potential Queuosine, Q, salvage protein family
VQSHGKQKDYRIPQMLHQLGCMLYSPPLDSHIRQLKQIKSKSTWEIELRGASIWCIELIRQEIERRYLNSNDAKTSGLNNNNRDADRAHDEDLLNRCRTKEEAETATKKEDQNSDSKSTKPHVNAILIDFFLYDTVKQLEQDGREMIPHHRTRSIWY